MAFAKLVLSQRHRATWGVCVPSLHRSFVEFVFFPIRRIVDNIIPDAPEFIIVPYDVIVEMGLPAKFNFIFIAPLVTDDLNDRIIPIIACCAGQFHQNNVHGDSTDGNK